MSLVWKNRGIHIEGRTLAMEVNGNVRVSVHFDEIMPAGFISDIA